MLTGLLKSRFQIAIVMLLTSTLVFAQRDVSGAADPQRFERFPLSWIVSYSEHEVPEFALATGPMKKLEGVIAPEQFDRISGQLTRITYRIPDNHSSEDAFQHYLEQLQALSAEILYQCRSRSCGSSNQWANNYFGVKELYGITRSQYYLAASLGGQRVALYTVKRGNRRIYLHMDLIEPLTQGVASIADDLDQKGFSWLESSDDSDLLLELLSEDQSLKLLIVGYDRSDASVNYRLAVERSADRAKALLDDLVAAGVAVERLDSLGVGAAVPVVNPPAQQGIWIQRR